MMKYVAYYRVSTARQGQSGLGLEAQQAAVAAFCEPTESFTEVESGKRHHNRPQLALAIATCKRLKATLIVAKLDRLARNVAFVSALMESGIDFIAVDNPNATRLTVHILAAVAEDEARRISERTKAALAAARRRGVTLGKPENLTSGAIRLGNTANVAAANQHKDRVRGAAEKLRTRGYSLAQIAATLTGNGVLTRRKKAWTPTAVMRLLA